MRRLRVLHLADVVNRYDFIDNVVRNLDPSVFEVEVATFTSESNICPPDYAADCIRHSVLTSPSRTTYPLTAFRLASLLAKHRVDLLHAHHFDPNAVAWLAARLRRSVRVVVGRHYSDAIYLNSTGAKRRVLLDIEGLVNAHAARIIAPSTAIRDLLVGRQGVPEAKVDVIPYPFDLTRYPLPSEGERRRTRAELGISGRFAVATVGRLYKDKGHRYMVDALRRLAPEVADLVWLVVGEGADRAELETAAIRSGVADRVRFLGWRKDALRIVGAVDVVVQPSLQEAYSQAMVEALAMGVPLVMTNVSGARDLIADGETGVVVERGDVGALVDAVRRLHGDPALRERLGRGGRHHVEATLTAREIVPRYEESYMRAVRA